MIIIERIEIMILSKDFGGERSFGDFKSGRKRREELGV